MSRPRDDPLLAQLLDQQRPQFGPPHVVQTDQVNVFGEPKQDPYFVHRVSLLGRKYRNNEEAFSFTLEQTRDYIKQNSRLLLDPQFSHFKDCYFLEPDELQIMIEQPETYSWVLTIQYRLLMARKTEPEPTLLMQLFMDSHLHLVNYICCRGVELTDEELEAAPEFRMHIGERYTLTNPGICFGDLPDARNFVDFIFYGHKVKAKTEGPFCTVAHCIFCKTNNRKCSNRHLVTILIKKFNIHPFLRAYVRMILCVGLLGNYNMQGVYRLAYNQRYFVYQLTDYRETPDDLFDQWLVENIRLTEILLREYQNRCIDSTYVFDQLLFAICKDNQWSYTKRSTLTQCNTARKMFDLSCENPNKRLREIDDYLRVGHDTDLKNTIPKPVSPKHPLWSRLPDGRGNANGLKMDEMVLLDKYEKWPPCDQNIQTISALHHGQRCYTTLQKLRYYLYTYRTDVQQVMNRIHCAECTHQMKEYLKYRDAWIMKQPIFLGEDIFTKNLLVARRRTNTPEWGVMNENQLASFYCSNDSYHWLSPSVDSIKDDVPLHVCGMSLAVYNPWTNQLHCNKDKCHQTSEVKVEYLYGRIVSMGNRRWTLCVHCGIIIPFDSFVLNTEGPACKRHFHNRPLQSGRFIPEDVQTPEELYNELFPVEEGMLEEYYTQPVEDREDLISILRGNKPPEELKPTAHAQQVLVVRPQQQKEPEIVPEVFKELLQDEMPAQEIPEQTARVSEKKEEAPLDKSMVKCLYCGKTKKKKTKKPYKSVLVQDSRSNLSNVYFCTKCYQHTRAYIEREQDSGNVVSLDTLQQRIASNLLYRTSRRQKIPKKLLK